MIKLDELFDMWKKDCQIDENNLDAATIQNAKLHSKYLEIHSMTKLQLKRKELEFKVLLKDKWLWYNGKMSQEEIAAKGWDYDPLNGLKILKGEMDYYYDSDKEIQEAQANIEYLKEMSDTTKEIIDTIKWRHQSIKNMIEWRKFTSGA
tara:strand:+ start:894 stop:1340 length:447 start_codon:yes stop_codon:yes gene_type:complete